MPTFASDGACARRRLRSIEVPLGSGFARGETDGGCWCAKLRQPKRDDITAGVQEGINSGAWTVGIFETGAHDRETLENAGAHFLVPSARDIPELMESEIHSRLARGELPGQSSA